MTRSHHKGQEKVYVCVWGEKEMERTSGEGGKGGGKEKTIVGNYRDAVVAN